MVYNLPDTAVNVCVRSTAPVEASRIWMLYEVPVLNASNGEKLVNSLNP